MYEYMRGLQRQFFKEPDFPELRQEINEIHQALTEGKTKPEPQSSEVSRLGSGAAGRNLSRQLRGRIPSGVGDHCGTEHGTALFLRRGRRTPDGATAEEG